MTDLPIGLGIIGCGWAASEIARVAPRLPNMKIVAACDANKTRAADFAQKAGAEVAADIDALIAHPGVSAVYVGIPHALLAPTVEKALNAGKHVVAEKPLALSSDAARHLGDLAGSRNLKLCVFFELRLSGTVMLAKRLIAEGEIGEPRLIRIRTIIDKRDDYWGQPDARNWRASKDQAGGGVLLMNTIHQLDTLRYITGLEFTSAIGEIGNFHAPVEVEDAGSATLRLTNGGMVSIVAAAHSPGANHEETIEIDGTEGRLDLPAPFGIGPIRLYRRATKVWNEIAVERPDSHLQMLDGFLSAIANDTSVPASAYDAAAAVGAVQAIYRSSRERRTVDIS